MNIKRSILLTACNLAFAMMLMAGCSTAKETPKIGDIVDVSRGDISVIVNSEGNLEMPYQYDLKFGTTGSVDKILVEEGDQVRQGALLAMLDNSAQINSIKTALLGVQTAKNNITLGCGTDHLPYNYPNLAVPRMMQEAQRDISKAEAYFSQGNYKDAGYWLIMTYFDIQVCEDLIKNMPDAAELAGAKTNSTYWPDTGAGSLVPLRSDYKDVTDYLAQYREKLISISNDLKDKGIPYEKIAPAFTAVQDDILQVTAKANSTISIKNRMTFYYTDTATSVDFLQASLRYLQDLDEYLTDNSSLPAEAAQKLYTAKLNLLVGRDVLANDTNIFESGGSINWQTLQKYNLSLQSAEISLYKAKQEIMKTAIIAPVNGTAVSVDLKKSYVLSAQDYSSKIAVSLVDTNTIRFKGTVDEIDISKVQRGQPVILQVDAIPNHVFNGTVRFISPYGTASGNVIKFPVLIDIVKDGTELRGGLRTTAEIQIAAAKDVLIIPVGAINTAGGKSTVRVVKDTTTTADKATPPEMRNITVGIQNLQFAEVISGLDEGEKVLIVNASAKPTNVVTTPRGMGR